MTNIEQISSLKKEATNDPVFNDVLHVFAVRERARKEVTLGALTQNMKKAGFEYSPKEVAPVLEKLSKLGFGRLEKDAKGRIRALKDIRVTLQSIGAVAAHKEVDPSAIKSFRARNRFGSLKTDTPKSSPKTRLTITLIVNEKPVNVQIPEGLSANEVATIVTKLQGVA